MYFVGAFERQLDERGRVALPPSLRSNLGERCYTSFGEDGCVAIRPEATFHAELEDLDAKVQAKLASRDRLRAFTGSAVMVTIDRQGRIQLDPRLREHAGLTNAPQSVTVLGAGKMLEIWESEAYARREAIGRAEIAGVAS